jgi:dihydrolipoamide dehydrogenase
MPDSSYDCIVIGSGPGGYVAAIRAAQLGMKTAVVEKADVGGRCLNVACIPAKAVLRVADVLSEIEEAGDFGISVNGHEVDWSKVSDRRLKVIKTLTGGVSGLFKKNGIEVIEGHGAVTDDGNVRVGGQFDGTEIQAKTVVLATGSVPKPIPGTQFGGRVIGTEEAWALSELPKTMAVVGAGASGSEIASAYARLGTKVTLLRRAVDELGQTVVMVTHDPRAAAIADRIVVLADGKVVHDGAAGSADEVTDLMKAVA